MASHADIASASTSAGCESSHETTEGLPPDEYDSDLEEPLFGEEDALYDEHADSEDEAWVQRHILNMRVQDDNGLKPSERDDDHSVSCPCCFRMLSMQCQAHEKFEGQFRAILVNNCRVIEGERLVVEEEGRKICAEERDVYRAVACANCGTEVAVLDQDDVYHFCNVIY